MRLKSFNLAIGCVGVPGAGKTTLIQTILDEKRRLHPAYVLIHDPNGDYDGVPSSDFEALKRNLAAHPARPQRLNMSGVDAVVCAMRVGKKSIEASGVRTRGEIKRGVLVVPTILVLDEVCDVEGMSPSYLHPEFKRAYLRRRHFHLGFIWGSQQASIVHPTMYRLATEVRVLRCTEDDADKLRRAGLPASESKKCLKFGRGEYLTHTISPFATAS